MRQTVLISLLVIIALSLIGCAPHSPLEEAIDHARYIESFLHLSREKLIAEVSSDLFLTTEEATMAVDSCNFNWNEEALMRANMRMLYQIHSYESLIKDLVKLDLFTLEQATYAADNCNADWYEQAVMYATEIVTPRPTITYDSLMYYLLTYGFTQEQAEYAANIVCGGEM